MSAFAVSPYSDPVLRLVLDPDLNRTKAKSDALVLMIQGFPLAERKVLKLCSASLSILQALEKLNLQLKSWEFLSLDINSDTHFDDLLDKNSLKSFNVSLAEKVLERCLSMRTKLAQISRDLDHVSAQSRTLTPLEYISDSGTTLTALVLRSIKLKTSVGDTMTVAYSKASLISIGSELEAMLVSDEYDMDQNDVSTVAAYKVFIGNLLRQLSSAIEQEDNTAKLECLAVMNDMEKMFDAFKLEKMRQAAIGSYHQQMEMYQLFTASADDEIYEDDEDSETMKQTEKESTDELEGYVNIHHHRPSPRSKSTLHTPNRTPDTLASDTEEFGDYDSDGYPGSMYSSFTSQPLVHSITRQPPTLPFKGNRERRDSSSSLNTSMLLHKTTIAEEMPNLLTAFDSIRNVKEDVTHYKEEESKELAKQNNHSQNSPTGSYSSREGSPEKENTPSVPEHQFPHIKNHLPDTPLYHESPILKQSNISNSPASYLYANNSLLSRLGIRPQIISASIPNMKPPHRDVISGDTSAHGNKPFRRTITGEEKENEDQQKPRHMLLTAENLECHNLSAEPIANDFVD